MEAVNHPAHYTDTGMRCDKCGAPIEDLRKAAKYIEFEIERRTG